MFDQTSRGKIKNPKIQARRAELGMFSYRVIHRPGSENVAPDTLSRVCYAIGQPGNLHGLHQSLGHPGVSRLWHFVRCKNLPYSIDEVRKVCLNCQMYCELKPRCQQSNPGQLVKATQSRERLSLDFKGPLPRTSKGNKYLFVVVDEFSRFLFAFPNKDASTAAATISLSSLFDLMEFPSFIHSNRGASFVSTEFNDYLHKRGIANSNSTPCHPTGNLQIKHFNQTIWKTVN